MQKIIKCYTLFDIAQTGVLNRPKPPAIENANEWLYKRNTQCNFDTILQAISLRSQPEIIKVPSKININFDEFDNFGFLFQQKDDESYPCWEFQFSIQHPSVFNDGISELGALYNDCHKIPMIKCGTEWDRLPNFIDCSPELKNIYFEINHD